MTVSVSSILLLYLLEVELFSTTTTVTSILTSVVKSYVKGLVIEYACKNSRGSVILPANYCFPPKMCWRVRVQFEGMTEHKVIV